MPPLLTVLQGQTAIKNGLWSPMDLVAFKVKVKITVAFNHVSEVESALHTMEYPSQ